MAVAPVSRVQSRAVWDLLVFLFNALIFLLLGAQFGTLAREEFSWLFLPGRHIALIGARRADMLLSRTKLVAALFASTEAEVYDVSAPRHPTTK